MKTSKLKKMEIALNIAKAQIKLEECDAGTVFRFPIWDLKPVMEHSKNCRRCTTLKKIEEALK